MQVSSRADSASQLLRYFEMNALGPIEPTPGIERGKYRYDRAVCIG
jgi:hypothetical protein